jgi:hypothetical protein
LLGGDPLERVGDAVVKNKLFDRRGAPSPALLAWACMAFCSCVWATACSETPASAPAKPKQTSSSKAKPDASMGASGAGGSSAKARDAGTAGKGAGGADASAALDAGDSGLSPGHIVTDGGLDCSTVIAGELPSELSCTGLYADIVTKEIASGVQAFAPAHPLWSDGADKQRWIYLPEGMKIDSSMPDEWHFPVGTKLFKEFSWKGHRVETRMFWKAAEGRWLKTAYHWNADESMATRFAGGAVDVAGETYYIPAPKDCDQCHKGRDDRALGFEAVSLGLSGATGLTLAELVKQDLLTDPPAKTELTIGDDGTGKAAAALGWLHVNCGVSCHSANTNADAYKTDMFLRLSADTLDGRSPADFDTIKTTVGVATKTLRWVGHQRIAPGSVTNSFLYTLISKRDPANMKDQMPPIASRVVDTEGMALVEAWIRALPAP